MDFQVYIEFIIFQINDDGAVARDGRLSVGQRILEVYIFCLLWLMHFQI